MNRISKLLLCTALLLIPTLAHADQFMSRLYSKEIGWASWGVDGTVQPVGTRVDTSFFSGADASDTSDVIDMYEFTTAPAYGGAAMTAPIGVFKFWLVCDFSAATDSIYYEPQFSPDKIHWAGSTTAGNYQFSTLPVSTTGLAKTSIITIDPDNSTYVGGLPYLSRFCRLLFKGSDQSGFKMAATRLYIAANTWRE